MFDNIVPADANSGNPNSTSWQSNLVNDSVFNDCQLLSFYKSSYGAGKGPGILLEKLDFLTDLNQTADKIKVKQSHKDYDFKPDIAFKTIAADTDGIFANDGTQTIYIVVQMDGERDRPWWQGGTDYRKTRHQVFSFNSNILFNEDGTGKITSGGPLSFEFGDSINTEGDGGGAWSEAPAFMCSNLSITISTLSGTPLDEEVIPQFILNSAKGRVQPPEPLNTENFDLTFIYQNPYREITNLLPSNVVNIYEQLSQSEYGNPLTDYSIDQKLGFIKKDFTPVSKVNILGDNSKDLQAYQTSSLDRQVCSAPNQVSLDFYLSPQSVIKTWGGQDFAIIYNEWGVLYSEDVNEFINDFDCSQFIINPNGTINATVEMVVNITSLNHVLEKVELTVKENNKEGVLSYIRESDVNNGDGWQIGDNNIKYNLDNASNGYYWDKNERQWDPTPQDPYIDSHNFSRIQLYATNLTVEESIIEGASIIIENMTIYDDNFLDGELQDETQFFNGSGISGGNAYVGTKFFVVDWNDKDNKHNSIEDYFKGFPKTLSSLRKSRNKNLYKITDVGFPLSHTYFTPGLKVIKSILFTHTTKMEDKISSVQPIRWKFITTRIFLDIPINKYPDFDEFGGNDYTTIPWPYTTPSIGGTDENSKYNKSIINTLGGGKIGDTDIIDERYLLEAKTNNEIGKSIRILDLEQVRFFNNGSYDMNTLLNIPIDGEYYVNPYTDIDYWNCNDWNTTRNHCFSDETSVGEIFIGDNIDIDLKANCKLEFNLGNTTDNSINDSFGKGNRGLLIGDYKIKKYEKGARMTRDSYIKIPATNTEDGAL